MNLEITVQIGTLISIIVGFLTFAWGVYWGVKSYNKQMNTQVFLTYAQRFDQIMESFPKDAWIVRLDLDQLPDPNPELSKSVLKYLNLCAEEYYLLQNKLLAKDVWLIWEDELKRTLRSPLFVREWKELAQEFEAYPEFRQYLENIQKHSS